MIDSGGPLSVWFGKMTECQNYTSGTPIRGRGHGIPLFLRDAIEMIALREVCHIELQFSLVEVVLRGRTINGRGDFNC